LNGLSAKQSTKVGLYFDYSNLSALFFLIFCFSSRHRPGVSALFFAQSRDRNAEKR